MAAPQQIEVDERAAGHPTPGRRHETLRRRRSRGHAPRPSLEVAPREFVDGHHSLEWRPLWDLAAACAGTTIAFGGLRAVTAVSSFDAPILVLPAVAVILIGLRGLYRTSIYPPVLDDVMKVIGAVSAAAMAVAVGGFLLNGRGYGSTWIRAWLFTAVAVSVARSAVTLAQRVARSRGLHGTPTLIVGAGVVGAQVARLLDAHPEYGLRPLGFIDDQPLSSSWACASTLPLLGGVDDIAAIVRRSGARSIVVTFAGASDARLRPLIRECRELGAQVSVVPRLFDEISNRVTYETLGGLPLLSFHGVSPKGMRFMLKYTSDRLFAAIVLLLLSPLLAVLALAVRLSSPGPVFFRQRRVGLDGTIFDLYKFRSMALADDSVSPEPSAVEPDARATAPGGVEGADRRTPVGRLMRRFSLDELPQFINVVKGDMSIIGPRPERPEYVELFAPTISRYGDRHRVKSGISGLAQVRGLRGRTSLVERIELDNFYIAHWSLGLDLKILLLTIGCLWRHGE